MPADDLDSVVTRGCAAGEDLRKPRFGDAMHADREAGFSSFAKLPFSL